MISISLYRYIWPRLVGLWPSVEPHGGLGIPDMYFSQKMTDTPPVNTWNAIHHAVTNTGILILSTISQYFFPKFRTAVFLFFVLWYFRPNKIKFEQTYNYNLHVLNFVNNFFAEIYWMLRTEYYYYYYNILIWCNNKFLYLTYRS